LGAIAIAGKARDTAEAVAHGILTAARGISGAALIMVAIFAGFAAGDW
jgi:hypothetical protein